MFPVLEALRSGADVDKVLIQQGLKSPHMHELRALISELEIPISFTHELAIEFRFGILN